MTNSIKERIEVKNGIIPMSVSDVAAHTGYSKGYIYNLVLRREIPVHGRSTEGKGCKLIFDKMEIDNWLFAKSRPTVEQMEADAEEIYLNILKSKK